MNTDRERMPGELAFGWLLVLFSLFVLYQATRISGFAGLSAPGTVPMGAAGIMVLCAAISLARTHRRRAPDTRAGGFFARVATRDIAIFVALIALFTLALEPIGFLASSFVFLAASILYLHKGSILFALAVAVGAIAAIHVVFRMIFLVVLPEGGFLR